MMRILKDTKSLIGIGLLVVLVFGYYFFFSGSSTTTQNLSSPVPSSPVSKELLVTLQNLHTITLDPGVFSDPVFISLSDFGNVIPPQATGRRNPFAPVP